MTAAGSVVARFSRMEGVVMDEDQIFEDATREAVEAAHAALDAGGGFDEAVEIGKRAFKAKAYELAGLGGSRSLSTREYRNELQTREV